MQEDKSIRELFGRYLQNQCTREEIKVLLRHFNTGENEALLKTLVRQQLEEEEELETSVNPQLLHQVFEKVKQTIATSGDEEKTIISPAQKRAWWRVAAAASVLVLIATTILVLADRKQTGKATAMEQKNPAKEIAPGRSNAVLTLGDGSMIVLDSAANGDLAQQGAAKIFKLNGQIAYNKTGETTDLAPVYNSLSTAKGNQYQLILSDGTRVWLNAASSLRFPTAFNGKERRVEVSGEAYLEVAKDPTKPFKVSIRSATGKTGEIEVLGTHFNINAYDDEAGVKTTLLEGAVKVQNSKSTKRLVPGQQAELTTKGITINSGIDVSQVVAWKEGYFWFNNTDLSSLMRQVARWYDVDVVFEGKASADAFSGKIARSVPLQKLLKVLELNDVKLRLEGRKLIVMP